MDNLIFNIVEINGQNSLFMESANSGDILGKIDFSIISDMDLSNYGVITAELFAKLTNGTGVFLNIDYIKILSNFQNKGYGFKMLDYFLTEYVPQTLPYISVIFLTASPETNIISLKSVVRFYEKYGFITTYKTEDANLMYKKL